MQAAGTEMASTGFPIVKLHETNYLTWATHVEMFLRKEGLWTVVENPPPQPDAAERRLVERALATIVLCVGESQIVHVRGITSAAVCWETLRQIHIQTTVASKIALTRRLYRARMRAGASVTEHMLYMKNLFLRLQEQNMTFPEVQKAYIVLSSLDQTFDHLVTALECLPEAQLTLAYITGRLQQEQERRLENNSRGKTTSAPVSAGATCGMGVSSPVPALHYVRKCFSCGAEDHLQRACPARRGSRKPRRQGPPSRHRPDISLVHATEKESTSIVWILDSGATEHVANSKSVFFHFRIT